MILEITCWLSVVQIDQHIGKIRAKLVICFVLLLLSVLLSCVWLSRLWLALGFGILSIWNFLILISRRALSIINLFSFLLSFIRSIREIFLVLKLFSIVIFVIFIILFLISFVINLALIVFILFLKVFNCCRAHSEVLLIKGLLHSYVGPVTILVSH